MKISIDRKRTKLYLSVAAAYLLFWLLNDLINTPELFLKRIVNNIWLISYLLAINFILFEYTLPFIKMSLKRILFGILLILLHLMLYSFGLYIWRNFGIQLHIYFELISHSSFMKGVLYQAPYGFFSLLFFGLTIHVYDYRKLKESAKQLRIEKQEAELNFLKSQTNPHFLFNTLNNIYSLARDKSDRTPESILKLSKILRYMLYETSGAYIAIEQEVKIINDYIALEKLRYDDSLSVYFNHDIEDMKQALPPLLLIPLVENAFKHGVSETRNKPYVDIYLSVKKGKLTFVLKNSTEEVTTDRSVKENIGLSNLRRQLELLYTDFNLSVQQMESEFVATLKIDLSSHV